MSKKIVIIGGEGNGGEVASVVADNRSRYHDDEWEVVGFVNDFDTEVDGYPVVGKLLDVPHLVESTDWYFVWAIHLVGRNYMTDSMFRHANIPVNRLATVISHAAFIGEHVTLGPGVFVMAHSYVGPMAEIGTCSLIMANCSISHNVKIGPLCHCSAGAVMAGYSELGYCADMALSSTILAHKRVGDYAMLGAASLATHDIPAGEIWIGTPARPLRKMPVGNYLGGGKTIPLSFSMAA